MWDAYRKHSFRCWEGLCNPVETLVPDAMLEPLFAGLRSAGFKFNHQALSSMQAGLEAAGGWPWEKTLEFVTQVWDDVGGQAYRALFETRLAEKPMRAYPADQSPHMKSGGDCDENGIRFRANKSILDPVYMAHESGHLVAVRDGICDANVNELQAFFVQEAAYNRLQGVCAYSKAAWVQRLYDLFTIACKIDMNVWLLKADVMRMRSVDGKQRRGVIYLHRHGFAGVLASAMYRNFWGMSAQAREDALGVLFGGATRAKLPIIMQTFGFSRPDDFYAAGRYTGNLMRRAVQECGLVTPFQAGAPKPGMA
ncbi:MAG: hypothetical protein KDJ49_03745 [Alphaproteobacteria bacterium]|nr:hypothetical protein [Alphaproteobacteria bacterium]USO08360.1 MAG: hypothetical protein H6866_03880 [Rhodospirillales bacterium]